VPASTPVRGSGIMTTPVMSDAQLGFRPSSAPPLNSSMNQWVSPAILNHYRQTAALTTVSNPNAAVPAAGSEMSAASAVGGIPPAATVLFPGDSTTLSASGRSQIRAAVAAFKAQGSSGTLRVVGHASSRTANMPVEKHLELIFAKSQARANAVAQELIHDGVPAAQVIVEAVGDSQPIYYESMPKGEDGNRRAEIFLQ
jgi:outer membrane protein OmpA-like peptidoglycan-associated protein